MPGYYIPLTSKHISILADYPYSLPISRGIAGIRVSVPYRDFYIWLLPERILNSFGIIEATEIARSKIENLAGPEHYALSTFIPER